MAQVRRNQQSLSRKVQTYYDHICQYCGEPSEGIDHIVPISFYADYTLRNLVASCRLCNSTASDKVFESFEHKRYYILENRKLIKQPAVTEEVDEEDYELKLYEIEDDDYDSFIAYGLEHDIIDWCDIELLNDQLL